MIDQPRYAEWARLSHRAAGFETFIVIAIQGLGKLDAQLTARDAAFLKLPQAKRESIEVSGDLTERFTSSYLWVLGVYEIVRTLDQRCREDPSLVSEVTARIIRDAKAHCHARADSLVLRGRCQ